MVSLAQLWMPIVISAVVVFIASSVIHMISPWHKTDYEKLPNESAIRDTLRSFNIPAGDYMVPRPSSAAEMKSPEFLEYYNRGPNMVVTVLPAGPWGMGRNLALWMVYLLVVALFAAYIAGRALGPGADSGEVFRYVTTTAVLGFAAALWQMSIWYRRKWSTTIKATVDGVIYAAITGGIFVWLWPHG